MSMPSDTATIDYDALFRAHERFLWGVAYRMTGSGADADDVVQQTFTRAMQSPPKDVASSWRPWLVRVAMNLARDALRTRKRRAYEGPWLPSPIETGDDFAAEVNDGAQEGADARYDRLESVTFAFLIALEALSPKQRAVLVLADVLGYSVREIADTLEMNEGAVKTTHHRARAAMSAYDASPTRPTRALQQKTRAALERFLLALANHDTQGVEAAVTSDVRAVSDGAGEYSAARHWIDGRDRVTRFFLGVGKRAAGGVRWDVRMINGMPAVVIAFDDVGAKYAPLVVQLCDVDDAGRVRALYSVLATKKLNAIRPP